MDENKALCFVDGERKICPCCMEAMIVKREITLDGLGDCIIAIATPGLICDGCGQPMARAEAAGAVEKILVTLDIWANNKPIPFKPPYAVDGLDKPAPEDALEPTPGEREQLERVAAESREVVKRAQAEYRAARAAVLRAREEARKAGFPIDDTPIPEDVDVPDDE